MPQPLLTKFPTGTIRENLLRNRDFGGLNRETSLGKRSANCSYELLRAGVENLTELLPGGAGPPLKLQLRPDHVVAFTGVDLHSGQGCRQHKVLQRLRL